MKTFASLIKAPSWYCMPQTLRRRQQRYSHLRNMYGCSWNKPVHVPPGMNQWTLEQSYILTGHPNISLLTCRDSHWFGFRNMIFLATPVVDKYILLLSVSLC